MVDSEHGPERAEATPEAVDCDPTLDIVRQLIEEAEAIPAPAQRPAGPATPRPEAPRLADPTPSPTPVPVSVPVPDADPDIWEDDPGPETWDDLCAGEAGAGYAVADGDDDTGEAHESGPARDGLLRRGMRALGAWARVRLAAGAAEVARFLRRPDAPRRLALALLVFFVIVWPWKVLLLTLLIPLAGLITWASVGSEGVAELVVRWYERLEAREPAKAERIRLRAAAVTGVLNHGLERLPESWTRGLYLPDFETDGYVPEKLKVDPFEDLAAEVQAAKRAGGDA